MHAYYMQLCTHEVLTHINRIRDKLRQVQCSPGQYSAVQYNAVQSCAVQYSTVQYSTVEYNAYVQLKY